LQTFYQPLFSYSFPFSNFPLAILFLLVILFPLESFPHQKAQSGKTQAKAKGKKAKSKKTQVKAKGKKQKPTAKAPKAKAPSPPSGASYTQWQTGWSRGSGERRIIVTGETCVPASLNSNLGDVGVLLFSVSWPGLCLSRPSGKSN
jgi:hypothetical protein